MAGRYRIVGTVSPTPWDSLKSLQEQVDTALQDGWLLVGEPHVINGEFNIATEEGQDPKIGKLYCAYQAIAFRPMIAQPIK